MVCINRDTTSAHALPLACPRVWSRWLACCHRPVPEATAPTEARGLLHVQEFPDKVTEYKDAGPPGFERARTDEDMAPLYRWVAHLTVAAEAPPQPARDCRLYESVRLVQTASIG